jgi:hypothetical protein
VGHRTTLILLLAGSLLCLSACGGDEGGGTTPEPDMGIDAEPDVQPDLADPDLGEEVGEDLPPENQTPTAVAGPDQDVEALTMVQLDATASSDPEGGTLTFIWTQEQGQTVRFDTASATPNFMAPANTTEIILALVVSDGDNLSVPDRVTIHVQGPNRAPFADAGAARTVLIDDVVSLDGGRSRDPDEGDVITYAWTQTDGPAVQLSDATSVEPRFRTDGFQGESVLTFALAVSDAELDSEPSEVVVTVRNHRPIAHAGRDGVVLQEGEYTLDGTGSTDPEDDDLTYRWSQVGGLEVQLTPAGSPTPSFVAPELAGPVEFQLIVHDGEAESVADRVTVLAVGEDWVDTDQDQLREETEAELGSDPEDPDTDNDGIPDGWEELSHEGIDYHGLGCSARHKDLLLEVDYQGEPLPEELIAELEAAFAALPIENPDGETGIALHVVHDAVLAENFQCFYPGDGNAGDRSDLQRLHRDTFHKLQFCLGEDVRLLASGGRHIVLQAPDPSDEMTRGRIVRAVLRGLGFDLGLSVGGGDNVDLKPNYPSVMNTAYTLTGAARFSSGLLPELDECALVEMTPFGDTPVDSLGFLETYLGEEWVVLEDGNVDWNGSGVIDDQPYELILRPGGVACATLSDHDDASTLSEALAPTLDVKELRRD